MSCREGETDDDDAMLYGNTNDDDIMVVWYIYCVKFIDFSFTEV